MRTHDPKNILKELQIILGNPTKKIGFLFGAGISIEDKNKKKLIKGTEAITRVAVQECQEDSPVGGAIKLMREEIEMTGEQFTIETLLSKISEKERGAGNEKLCGLDRNQLAELRKKIQNFIRKEVSIHNKENFNVVDLCHHDFARWIKNADRDVSVEIFTTNYDFLLELALEKNKVPYFDGFVGSYNAFFCPEWIEDENAIKGWTKLWKLHGSLGWANHNGEITRSWDKERSEVIYPSFLKYDQSRKQPYLSYMDRLSYFLKQEDSVLFICGYSFGDEHINDQIISSLMRPRSAQVFVMKSGELEEKDILSDRIAKINSKISVYAKNAAVIGGEYGQWKLEREPDKNESFNILNFGFDEDGAENKWTGKGKFTLGKFRNFTKFLSHFNNRFLDRGISE